METKELLQETILYTIREVKAIREIVAKMSTLDVSEQLEAKQRLDGIIKQWKRFEEKLSETKRS